MIEMEMGVVEGARVVPISRARIWDDIAKASDRAYSYVYAGLRRGIASYRREFLQGSTVPGRRARLRGGRKGLKRTFLWEARPRVTRFRPDAEQLGNIDEIRIRFRSRNLVAQVLEFGATIRARRRKFLALPMGRALRSDGRVKENWATPARVRQRLGILLFPITARNGQRFLAYDKNNPRGEKSRRLKSGRRRRQRIRLVFWLTREVRISPQLGFYAGWAAHVARGEVDRRLEIEFAKYMRQVWGERYPVRSAA